MAPSQRRRSWHGFQHLYIWVVYAFTTAAIIVGDVVGIIEDSISGDRHGRRPAAARLPGDDRLEEPVRGGHGRHPASGCTPGCRSCSECSRCWRSPAWCSWASCSSWPTWCPRPTSARSTPGRRPAGTSGRCSPASTSAPEPDRCPCLVTWYCGGLNYQTEHHLFPALPHPAYRAIAPSWPRPAPSSGSRTGCNRRSGRGAPVALPATSAGWAGARPIGRPGRRPGSGVPPPSASSQHEHVAVDLVGRAERGPAPAARRVASSCAAPPAGARRIPDPPSVVPPASCSSRCAASSRLPWWTRRQQQVGGDCRTGGLATTWNGRRGRRRSRAVGFDDGQVPPEALAGGARRGPGAPRPRSPGHRSRAGAR